MTLRRAAGLACLAVLGLGPAPAAADEARMALEEVSAECGTAYVTAHDTLGLFPAPERLRAVRKLQECIDQAKVKVGQRRRERQPELNATLGPPPADDKAKVALLRAREAERNDQATQVALEAAGESSRKLEKTVDGQASFMGINFGVGIGVSFGKEIVSEAVVGPDNVVRASKRYRQLPRVLLESHYFGWWCSSPACNAGRFGWGPYFGIVTKGDTVLSAVSLGLMMGFRNKDSSDSAGFSVGAGALLDDAVTSLAPGFRDGQPLPAGETAVRYEQKPRWSAILFCTRTF